MADSQISATWTMEGKIFIKKGDRKAKKVITHEEIIEYCEEEE